jgi:hypothetical protein
LFVTNGIILHIVNLIYILTMYCELRLHANALPGLNFYTNRISILMDSIQGFEK